jgi:hypothetical protein
MTYKYDIFVSYKKRTITPEWLSTYFLPMLVFYVEQHLCREIKYFLDTTEIDPGDSWSLRLQDGVAHSRILVPVWLPEYFTSSWCRKELAAMLLREEHYNLRTSSKPCGLIVPVQVHDGICFPDIAQKIQYAKFESFFTSCTGFRDTPKFLKFENEVQQFSRTVAAAINFAPEWESKWKEYRWDDLDDSNLCAEQITFTDSWLNTN